VHADAAAIEILPASQLVHEVEAVVPAYCPAMQLLQDVLFDVAWKVPNEQSLQELWAVKSWYFPAAQSLHEMDEYDNELPTLYVPTAQLTHADAAGVLTYIPAAQYEQTLFPETLDGAKVPAAHDAHVVEASDENVPAPQAVQVVRSESANFPAAQEEHEAAPL
jgi:hypothetical protein